MKFRILIAALLLPAAAILRAETTPLSTPLAEEKETTIECELKDAPHQSEIPVYKDPADPAKTPGVYHYKLWIPKGYNEDAQRRWPCFFVMSPGGNAGFATMKDRLRGGGYVVVMLEEAKNGDWPPIIGNFLAAHDDVVQRVRIQEGLKFATGQSGGARASSVFAQIRPGFSGLIMQAAGASYEKDTDHYNVAGLKRNTGLWIALTMGDHDGNKSEIDPLTRQLGAAHLKIWMFPGGHAWAPAGTFNEALDWIEHKIYFEGPAQLALQPAYSQYFKNHLATLQAATTPWEKYKLGNDLLLFTQARGSALDPQSAAIARNLPGFVMQLRNDPAVTREAMAADALTRLQADQAHTDPTVFNSACLDLATRYPGTEAAARAQQLANPAAVK